MDNSTNQPSQNINISESADKAGVILSKTDNLKKIFFQVLIGCLVSSAFIAVVAVLAGGFNDTLAKSIGTIAMVAIHTTLGFSYINENDKYVKKSGAKSLELFSNTIFTLIAISFITSIFAVWGIINPDLTTKLYLAYGVTLFATLHADLLYRLRGYQQSVNNIISANYIFMAIVALMLYILIFAPDSQSLGDFYYRLLAAAGIVDATMTLTVTIMHRLYLQKHPELAKKAESAQVGSRSFIRNPLVVIVLIYIIIQVIGGIFALLLGSRY